MQAVETKKRFKKAET